MGSDEWCVIVESTRRRWWCIPGYNADISALIITKYLDNVDCQILGIAAGIRSTVGIKLWCQLCELAAQSGNLSMLQWAHSIGCFVGGLVTKHAVIRKDMSMLEWLKSAGCLNGDVAIVRAVEDRDLALVRWAHSVGCQLPIGIDDHAARNGNLDMLKWLHCIGYLIDRCWIWSIAYSRNDTCMVQWLESISITGDEGKARKVKR